MKSLWCPNCKKKGLNPYNKDGIRPEKTDDIDHLWCLYCSYRLGSEPEIKFVKDKSNEGKP